MHNFRDGMYRAVGEEKIGYWIRNKMIVKGGYSVRPHIDPDKIELVLQGSFEQFAMADYNEAIRWANEQLKRTEHVKFDPPKPHVAVVTFNDTYTRAPSFGREYSYYFDPALELKPGDQARVRDGTGAGKTVTVRAVQKGSDTGKAKCWLDSVVSRAWSEELREAAEHTAEIAVLEIVNDQPLHKRIEKTVTHLSKCLNRVQLKSERDKLAGENDSAEYHLFVGELLNEITRMRGKVDSLAGINTSSRMWRAVRRLTAAGLLDHFEDILQLNKKESPVASNSRMHPAWDYGVYRNKGNDEFLVIAYDPANQYDRFAMIYERPDHTGRYADRDLGRLVVSSWERIADNTESWYCSDAIGCGQVYQHLAKKYPRSKLVDGFYVSADRTRIALIRKEFAHINMMYVLHMDSCMSRFINPCDADEKEWENWGEPEAAAKLSSMSELSLIDAVREMIAERDGSARPDGTLSDGLYISEDHRMFALVSRQAFGEHAPMYMGMLDNTPIAGDHGSWWRSTKAPPKVEDSKWIRVEGAEKAKKLANSIDSDIIACAEEHIARIKAKPDFNRIAGASLEDVELRVLATAAATTGSLDLSVLLSDHVVDGFVADFKTYPRDPLAVGQALHIALHNSISEDTSIMNMKPISVVSKTFVSGGPFGDLPTEVGQLTDASLIQGVRALEKEVAELDKIENKAKKVTTRIEDLKRSIDEINAILDARPDTPPKA